MDDFLTERVEEVYYVYSLITDSILEIFNTLEEAQSYSANSKEPTKVRNIQLTRYRRVQ